MTPSTYELRPSDEPQPKLLDADPVTTDWPMPPVRKWTPTPRATVREAIAEMARKVGL